MVENQASATFRSIKPNWAAATKTPSLYWVQWGVLLDSLTEMIIIILVILILVIIIFHDGNPDQPVEPIRDLKSCIIIG